MHNQIFVYRGNEVESSHRFSYVLTDRNGNVQKGSETLEISIFPRSAIKLIQVLPFITSGAYKNSQSDEEAIAIACGSHNAEEKHVSKVSRWLESNSLTPKALVCGSGLPRLNDDIRFVYENKISLTPAFNNCSGKHTAMVLTCKHLGYDTNTYHHIDHPLQKEILQNIEAFCGRKLDTKRVGIDGCALPNFMMTLKDLAVAAAHYAYLANQKNSPLEQACDFVLRAIQKYPEMIAGRERLCTDIAKATNGRIIAKVGAEGVYMALLRDQELGLAIKVEDGSFRAVELALVHVLQKHQLLKDHERIALKKWFEIPILNTLGDRVGKVSANL